MRIPLQYKGPRSLPFEAPHFTTAMLAQNASGAIIPTTHDLHQQQTVERVLQAYVREQTRMGIRNAAALLVDARDLSVRAAVGSAVALTVGNSESLWCPEHDSFGYHAHVCTGSKLFTSSLS
jgi:membrane carboxypeptidase/penicillin-binding protein PbpC